MDSNNKIETTKPKPFCFVLMPFDKTFDDIYQLGIKAACDIAGAYCERVDEQMFSGMILDRVYNQISKADIVVADMTGKNPNVFYEVGYAHALDKKTILLTQRADDIPFDLKHFPHIIYNESIISLREQLSKKVKWGLEISEVTLTEKLAIEVFCDDENLGTNNKIVEGTKGTKNLDHPQLRLNLTFFNASNLTFYSGDFKVGIICSYGFKSVFGVYEVVHLPDKCLMVMLPNFDTLYPLAYASKHVELQYSFPVTEEKDITIRIFSEIGTRDFKIKGSFIK